MKFKLNNSNIYLHFYIFRFYKRNTVNFFKDRHWTDREFEELQDNGEKKNLLGYYQTEINNIKTKKSYYHCTITHISIFNMFDYNIK